MFGARLSRNCTNPKTTKYDSRSRVRSSSGFSRFWIARSMDGTNVRRLVVKMARWKRLSGIRRMYLPCDQ
jgi:hypothetical protein